MGWDTRDQVCMSKESTKGNGCMEDYLFRSVVYQEELEGLAGAGLIGLAPSGQSAGSQLFVPSLFEQGAIKNNMFSMFIDQNDISKITLGGYDLDKYASGSLNWYDITTDFYWEIPMHSVSIGEHAF